MIIHCPKASIGGRVRAQVLEPISKRDLSRRGAVEMNRDGVLCLGRVVYQAPWVHNLVSDYGLNRLCTNEGVIEQMTYACAGFDGTSTADPVASNVSQAGTTATAATPGAFAVGDVGKVIAWDADPNGIQTYITAYIDDQNVTVADTQAIGASAATLYKVAQAGLISERGAGNSNTPYRSNSYLSGANGTTHVSGSADHVFYRTYDFSSQLSDVVYREVGFSSSSTVAANLLNRIRLAGDVNVLTGQQLRVTLEMNVSLGPVVPTSAAPTITGWGVVDGDECLVRTSIETISSSGSISAPSVVQGFIWPYFTGSGEARVWVSPVSTALGNYEAAYTDRSGGSVVDASRGLLAYTSKTFYRDFQGIFTPAQGAFTVRSIGLGAASIGVAPGHTGQSFTFVADASQSKAATHRLTINFRRSVGRLLA